MVFRAVILSMVLTLAVGQNAALLMCTTKCDAPAAPASAPHHEHSAPASASAPHNEHSSNHSSTSLTVAGSECCDDMRVSAAAFVREDVRRNVSSPDAGYAIPVPSYEFLHPTSAARPGQGAGRQWWLDARPLSSALRI